MHAHAHTRTRARMRTSFRTLHRSHKSFGQIDQKQIKPPRKVGSQFLMRETKRSIATVPHLSDVLL